MRTGRPSPAELAQLPTIPLFAGLSAADLDLIGAYLTRAEIAGGKLVLTRDQRQSDYLYILLAGAVKVQVEQPDGSVAIVSILGPHQIIGEMSHADGLGCSATVETIDRCELLLCATADFHDLVQRFPTLNTNLQRTLSERLRSANRQILSLITLNAARRVAAQILALADVCGVPSGGLTCIPFRLTQGTLAAMTGLSRVRVNRTVQDLIDLRAITAPSPYHIAVADRTALAAFACPASIHCKRQAAD